MIDIAIVLIVVLIVIIALVIILCVLKFSEMGVTQNGGGGFILKWEGLNPSANYAVIM